MKAPVNVIIVDDHVLFAKALKTLVSSFENTFVMYIAKHGQDLIDYLETATTLPDVILLDVRMPVLNGVETSDWLEKNHPGINKLAITMENDDDSVYQMIRNGCKGYLLKDIEPPVLNEAIQTVAQGKFVYSDLVDQNRRMQAHLKVLPSDTVIELNDREQEFFKLVCKSDLSYKEIATTLNLSPKTIDNKRADLFKKFGVHTRIAAVLFAMEHKLM